MSVAGESTSGGETTTLDLSRSEYAPTHRLNFATLVEGLRALQDLTVFDESSPPTEYTRLVQLFINENIVPFISGPVYEFLTTEDPEQTEVWKQLITGPVPSDAPLMSKRTGGKIPSLACDKWRGLLGHVLNLIGTRLLILIKKELIEPVDSLGEIAADQFRAQSRWLPDLQKRAAELRTLADELHEKWILTVQHIRKTQGLDEKIIEENRRRKQAEHEERRSRRSASVGTGRGGFRKGRGGRGRGRGRGGGRGRGRGGRGGRRGGGGRTDKVDHELLAFHRPPPRNSVTIADLLPGPRTPEEVYGVSGHGDPTLELGTVGSPRSARRPEQIETGSDDGLGAIDSEPEPELEVEEIPRPPMPPGTTLDPAFEMAHTAST